MSFRSISCTIALLLPLAALAQSTPAPNNGPLTPAEQRAVRAFQCLAHMRGIAQAINIYGVDHDDKPPANLGTLCLDASVDLPNFVCPGGGGAFPDNWRTMKPEDQAAWVNAHTDYILIPANSIPTPMLPSLSKSPTITPLLAPTSPSAIATSSSSPPPTLKNFSVPTLQPPKPPASNPSPARHPPSPSPPASNCRPSR